MNINEALLFVQRNQKRIQTDIDNKNPKARLLVKYYKMYWKCKENGSIVLLCDACKDYLKEITTH
jgi:hypothetical protein